MGPMIIYEGSRRNRFGDILNVMQQKNEFTFVIEDRSIYRPPELRDENTLTITQVIALYRHRICGTCFDHSL